MRLHGGHRLARPLVGLAELGRPRRRDVSLPVEQQPGHPGEPAPGRPATPVSEPGGDPTGVGVGGEQLPGPVEDLPARAAYQPDVSWSAARALRTPAGRRRRPVRHRGRARAAARRRTGGRRGRADQASDPPPGQPGGPRERGTVGWSDGGTVLQLLREAPPAMAVRGRIRPDADYSGPSPCQLTGRTPLTVVPDGILTPTRGGPLDSSGMADSTGSGAAAAQARSTPSSATRGRRSDCRQVLAVRRRRPTSGPPRAGHRAGPARAQRPDRRLRHLRAGGTGRRHTDRPGAGPDESRVRAGQRRPDRRGAGAVTPRCPS